MIAERLSNLRLNGTNFLMLRLPKVHIAVEYMFGYIRRYWRYTAFAKAHQSGDQVIEATFVR